MQGAMPRTAPPTILGLTRWEWDGGGIRFRIWTRPVIGGGGRDVVPVTLLWDRPDGTHGMARCGGILHAMECAEAMAAAPSGARA
jgi:hypothetical protein